jgi:hypothetical protein
MGGVAVHGAGAVPMVDPVGAARAALEALRKKASDAMTGAGQSYFGPDVALARKAAGVLAEGAKNAAHFAGQVSDDIKHDLDELASKAWSFASAPLFILAMLWLWNESR